MENRCGLCKCWVEQDRVTYKDEEGNEREMGIGDCRARGPVLPPFPPILPEEGPPIEEPPVEEWVWPQTFESSFCVHDFRFKDGLENEIAKVTAMFGGKP